MPTHRPRKKIGVYSLAQQINKEEKKGGVGEGLLLGSFKKDAQKKREKKRPSLDFVY